MMSSTSTKRRHTPSPSRTSSPSRTPKALRVSAPVRSPLLCTLPPTCHPPNRATPLSDSRALEVHYATHHAHVCSSQDCGCIFPDARLLELHIAECHNPLAAILSERGEKTFACHLSSCPGIFATPKARRLHLIDVHAYPKEYFFAVTNKGIGGLLRRWGDGASLLRGPWRPRDAMESAEGDHDGEFASPLRQSPLRQHSDPGDGGDNETSEGGEPVFPNPILADQKTTADTINNGGMVEGGNADAGIDALTSSVSALSLVPSSIRFGRGNSAPRGRAGLATRSGRPVARNSGHPPVANHHHISVGDKGKDKDIDAEAVESNIMEPDAVVESNKTPPTRGRRGRGGVSGDGRGGGGRGLGRAGGFVPPPPRGRFLLRGAAGRGFPRGLVATAMRGRGAGV